MSSQCRKLTKINKRSRVVVHPLIHKSLTHCFTTLHSLSCLLAITTLLILSLSFDQTNNRKRWKYGHNCGLVVCCSPYHREIKLLYLPLLIGNLWVVGEKHYFISRLVIHEQAKIFCIGKKIFNHSGGHFTLSSVTIMYSWQIKMVYRAYIIRNRSCMIHVFFVLISPPL